MARATFMVGSSPLARGTPHSRYQKANTFRFIPARAGNTGLANTVPPASSVHPRSRGEHALRPGRRRAGLGSSPLARGTPASALNKIVPYRFIPARAGNTPGAAGAGGSGPVHPRSRGEHSVSGSLPICLTGSSPLARGTPRHRGGGAPLYRFIPARAGNTRPGDLVWASPPVHPRSRGEHIQIGQIAGAPNGSSPLARGTPGPGPGWASRCRFIPARAGNTCPGRWWRTCASVHPRSRGEHC